ncbi:MAG: hypothetical protein DWI26_08135, partial [Planctomycetota bacterium]
MPRPDYSASSFACWQVDPDTHEPTKSDARLLSNRHKAKSEAILSSAGRHPVGTHRARANRARARTLRVHGINPTCVTAHRPLFPKSRIMLLIPISLSITKFLPEQRVDQDGMIQSHDRSIDRSSTSTSTKKNSQNKTMHRSGRSAALNFRNYFGGHSVMVAD